MPTLSEISDKTDKHAGLHEAEVAVSSPKPQQNEKEPDATLLSPQKMEANRRNAQLSTGPRTKEGRSRSRRDALKHGILATTLLVGEGEGEENVAEWDEFLGDLGRDRAPVGTLEEVLVQEIAVCTWRLRRALRCEAGLIRRGYASESHKIGVVFNPRKEAIRDQFILPLGEDLDRILRYETTVHRQLVYAINQLERMQRSRAGENVPAPLSVQVSGDK